MLWRGRKNIVHQNVDLANFSAAAVGCTSCLCLAQLLEKHGQKHAALGWTLVHASRARLPLNSLVPVTVEHHL